MKMTSVSVEGGGRTNGTKKNKLEINRSNYIWLCEIHKSKTDSVTFPSLSHRFSKKNKKTDTPGSVNYQNDNLMKLPNPNVKLNGLII